MPTPAASTPLVYAGGTQNKYDGYVPPASPAPTAGIGGLAAPATPTIPGPSVAGGYPGLLFTGEIEYGAASAADRINGYDRPIKPSGGGVITSAGSVATPAAPTPSVRSAATGALPKTGSQEDSSNSFTGGNLNGYPKPVTPGTVGPLGPQGK